MSGLKQRKRITIHAWQSEVPLGWSQDIGRAVFPLEPRGERACLSAFLASRSHLRSLVHGPPSAKPALAASNISVALISLLSSSLTYTVPADSIGYSRKFRLIVQFQDHLISNFASIFTMILLCHVI